MGWKIDGRTAIPPFVMARGDKEGTHELRIAHGESGTPWDFPVRLEVLEKNPSVALVTATDRRGFTDNSQCYKFMCYSFDDRQRIITSYLVYSITGPVIVKAWDDEKKSLLENVDMEHFDIHLDKSPERLIARHLERIAGRNTITECLRDSAEKTYFDILWNISQFYGLYSGSVPEIPTPEERAAV